MEANYPIRWLICLKVLRGRQECHAVLWLGLVDLTYLLGHEGDESHDHGLVDLAPKMCY